MKLSSMCWATTLKRAVFWSMCFESFQFSFHNSWHLFARRRDFLFFSATTVYKYKMKKGGFFSCELAVLWAGWCSHLGSVTVRDAGLAGGGRIVESPQCVPDRGYRHPLYPQHSLGPKLRAGGRAASLAHVDALQDPTEVSVDGGMLMHFTLIYPGSQCVCDRLMPCAGVGQQLVNSWHLWVCGWVDKVLMPSSGDIGVIRKIWSLLLCPTLSLRCSLF